MASIKSKVKSVVSKAKSAATSYAKNVAGGAGIVAKSVSDAANKVGGKSQTGMVFSASTPQQVANLKKSAAIPAKGSIVLSGNKIATTQNKINAANKPKATGLVDLKGNPVSLPKGMTFNNSGLNINSINQGLQSGALSQTNSKTTNLARSSGSGSSTALTAGQLNGDTSNLSLSNFSSPSGLTTQSNNRSLNTSNVAQGSGIIGGANLGTQTKPFPTVEDYQSKTDYASMIPVAQDQTAVETPTTKKDTALEDLIKSMADVPSSEDAYAKAQRESGILARQQEVSDLTGKLNAIVNKGQAQQLSIVGQGRGIPEAIIGGQQAQIGRETAIAALPVQAQLEAAQGNMAMAEQNLDRLFKIYSEDARNQYEYKRDVKKLLLDYASEDEKRAFDKQDKLEERAYTEQQNLYDSASTYAKQALANGQTALFTKIMSLDSNSPAYNSELIKYMSQVRKPLPTSSGGSVGEMKASIQNTLRTGYAPSGELIGNPRGADGFVDPYVYITAFQNWTGSVKDFLLAFPVKNNVNPESYDILPAALKPTTKGSTATTSSGRSA